jgi:hypothetical protein
MTVTADDPIHGVVSRALNSQSGMVAFYQQRPQGDTRPCVVYTVPTSDHEYSDDGPDGLAFYRVNFTTWAPSFEECRRIHNQVKQIFRVTGGEFEPTDENDVEPAPREIDKDFFNLSTDFNLWVNY